MDSYQRLTQQVIDLEGLTSNLKANPLSQEQLLRINIGQEWWVDMNQKDFVAYLGRRKAAHTANLQEFPCLDGRQLTETTIGDETSSSSSSEDTETIVTPIISDIAVQPEREDLPAGLESEQSGSAIKFVEAIKSLPEALRQPLEELLSSKTEQEVLNDEGLPVVEIREQSSSSNVETEPKLQEAPVVGSKDTEASDYWSPAAVEMRRKLRERLFTDDSDSDQESEHSVEHTHLISIKTTPSQNKDDFNPNRSSEAYKGKEAARVELLPEELPETGGRKSVSFAPHTKVRTFEKGGAISTPPLGSVQLIQKGLVSDSRFDDSPFRGLKKGFLSPSRQTRPLGSSSTTTRHDDGFDKAEKKASVSTVDLNSDASGPEAISSSMSFRSEIVPDVQGEIVSLPSPHHGHVDGNVATPIGDTLEPLAPAHENVRYKQPSVFLARQEASRMPMFPKRLEESSTVQHTDTAGSDRKGDPMKFKVVERPPRLPSVQKKASENGRAHRTSPADSSPEEAPSSTPNLHANEEQESDGSFEYSDSESINFDMDEGLLAREAAMAYHQKRSQLGRRALGGWTGHVDESGTTGFYSEELDAARGLSDVVPFGGMVLPGADLRSLNVSTDEDDARDAEIPSITLPSLIPGAENLPSMIRIGKLENGNLILQDEDNSEDEGEDRSGPSASRPEAAVTENSMKKRNKANILARLSKGELDEMIREEAIQEKEMKDTRTIVDYNANALPRVRTESESATESVKVEKDSNAAVLDVVTERKGAVESLPQQPSKENAIAKPAKVSRFKAARLRGST